MDTQTINTVYVAIILILSILCLIFCVLALFVLVYYIRRRYKLYKETNRIPQELLIKESYRNYLKNLKIKCNINNFIIVILQWNPAYRGRRVSGHPSYRGRSLGICFFRFKNNPACRGAIHLSGHSTEDFFHLSNMLYTFEQLSILCNGR